MPRQTGFPDALRAAGLTVVEHGKWRTLGSTTFTPKGLVVHHTGPWSIPGIINLLINGRSDLPGPLCQVGLRVDGTCDIIASGRANHAGSGGWRGLRGNTQVWGIEAYHKGDKATPWPAAQLDAFYRASAALATFSGFGAGMVCGHKEWRPGDKIDPIGLDMNDFRAQVERILTAPAPPDQPAPQPTQEGTVVANAPFACLLVHPPTGGYLEIGEDGGVFNYGGAPFYGSLGGLVLNQPIVDAQWTPDYGGYYLLGRDGGVFAFGNARHQGNALWSG